MLVTRRSVSVSVSAGKAGMSGADVVSMVQWFARGFCALGVAVS